MTEPSNRHVPPWRSTWSMRSICKNRTPLTWKKNTQ